MPEVSESSHVIPPLPYRALIHHYVSEIIRSVVLRGHRFKLKNLLINYIGFILYLMIFVILIGIFIINKIMRSGLMLLPKMTGIGVGPTGMIMWDMTPIPLTPHHKIKM